MAANALILSALGFVAIAILVASGAADQLDRRMLDALRMQDPPEAPMAELLNAFFTDITRAGGRSVLGLFGLLAAGYLAILRDWRALGFLALALLGATMLADLFKEVFERARPAVGPKLAEVSSYSFPSGHATNSAIVYLASCSLLARAAPTMAARAWIAMAAALVVLLVGFSRVWLGVHFPSDVLAGWCLGTAWASACCLLMKPGRR